MHEDLLRAAYAAFNDRDIDAALGLMAPDVDWPNGWEGGRVHGVAAVRDYWTRQFAAIDSHVEPVGFRAGPQGTVDVDVHEVIRDPAGAPVSDTHVVHRWTIVAGRVQRMDIEER